MIDVNSSGTKQVCIPLPNTPEAQNLTAGDILAAYKAAAAELYTRTAIRTASKQQSPEHDRER